MTPSHETSRPVPVVQLPHRTMADSSAAVFANNTIGTGLGPSSIPDFDPNQHIPLEDMANMDDLFSNMAGMDDGIDLDLDLTNVVVDPLFLSTGGDGNNANHNHNNGDGDEQWL